MGFKRVGIVGMQDFWDSKELPDVSEEFQKSLVEQVLSSERKKTVGSRSYNPSGFGCLRALYYKRTGEPITPRKETYSSIRIKQCGTSSHEALQNYLSQMPGWNWVNIADYISQNGLSYLQVLSVKDNGETLLRDTRYDIVFCVDGLVNRNGFYYLIEIKTETDEKLFQRKAPEEEHIKQASCYAMSLSLRGCLFIYEGRNYCSTKCYFVPINAEMKGQVTDTIITVEKYVQEGVVPPVQEDKKNCIYCNYVNSCRRDCSNELDSKTI